MANDRILNLGFIGLGQAFNRMMQQYSDIAKLPYRIAAAAEKRPHALDKFKREFNGEAFDDLEEMCKSPNVDVVYVATPPELHREHVEIAARNGKHIVVEKPMALNLEDCEAMIAAAESNGVKLLAGHTHSFDAPIRKMREIVKSGEIGELSMINTWNINEFNPRPWPTEELKSTFGPILNQGPHQVDIVRQIAGGMVKSVRASTIADGLRGVEGGYTCFLEFENGVPATLVYDARGFFDTSELFWWVGEGGTPRDPDTNFTMKRNYLNLAEKGEAEMERIIEEQKEQGRYGAEDIDPETWELWGYAGPDTIKHQPFFGLTLVSCEKGALRQSPDGIFIYGETEKREVPLKKELRGRAAELMDLYNGVVNGQPVFHDGRWGMATLEVCLAIIESSKQGKEIQMSRQMPVED
jgi:phthalate 4,5-cis-dihydrodiol dehydrogenase